MSKLAKVLQAAAGNTPAGDLAAAIDFDGTSDYLSRSSDMTGNADSKTFTFSCWVYALPTSEQKMLYSTDVTDNGFKIYIQSNNTLGIEAWNSSGTRVLQSVTSTQIPLYTWTSIIVSLDAANTSNRSVYINDVLASSTWYTYSNLVIDFTRTTHKIGFELAARYIKGRLSNVFLDYTYRDLSVTNNRRLFITEDGKPADGQAGLNPIMYMPLDDPEDIGNNAGTGGDFTVNGVMARSGRGPNQDNTVASYFASNDYLSNSIGLSGSAWTISFIYENYETTNTAITGIVASSTYTNGQLTVLNYESDKISFGFYEPTGGKYWQVDLLKANGMDLTIQKTYHITMSCDFSDVTKTKCYVNGVLFSHYTNGAWNSGTLSFSTSLQINNDTSNSRATRANVIGELYINPVYTDLATSNPFWDSDLNKPVSLRKVIEDTGITPAIALPMLASNPGLNLGTGGNFTVTSGPYTGARGPSEFIGRSAFKATDSGNYFNFGGPITDSSTTTVSGFVMMTGTPNSNQLGYLLTSGSAVQLSTTYNDVSKIRLQVTPDGSGGNFVMNVDAYIPTAWNAIFFSCDTSGNLYLRVNNTESSGASRSGNINLQSESDFYVMSYDNTTPSYGAKNIASLYFTTSYIDFTQESNRLLFLDGLGYPTNIQQAIDDSVIPTPLIYMPFDNVSALYTNNGTAGNFTQVGTITAGPDVGS